ncbi:unnamed protein product, partial [Ectocarpus sp. 12 AP-2014]
MFRSGLARCHPRQVSAPGGLRLSCQQPLGAWTGSSGSSAIRVFSTEPAGPEISKRQQFKQIAVDAKVMRHLDALGLGMEKKKI